MVALQFVVLHPAAAKTNSGKPRTGTVNGARAILSALKALFPGRPLSQIMYVNRECLKLCIQINFSYKLQIIKIAHYIFKKLKIILSKNLILLVD
jgi:hypothetical protein